MLARSTGTPVTEGGTRKPHCRTCGKAMLGHKKALCQLRTPSEESNLGSIFQDTSLPTTSPCTPTLTPWIGSQSIVPRYPTNFMTPEPSWEAPPERTFYQRQHPRNADVLTPPKAKGARGNPLLRMASWVSTEKVESEFGDKDDTTSRSRSRSRGPQSTLPLTEAQVDVIDAAGHKVVGLDLSTLNDNLKSIIRQADSAGFYSAIVRPRIGYNRGSLDIRTKEDVDKNTTIFVSTGPDTMSLNVVCTEALRKAKLMAEGGPPGGRISWASAFFAMLLASFISFWASLIIIRSFW